MPRLEDFRIYFDKPGATYVPGEIVTGKVCFNLSNSKNIKEIRIKARGKAKVHWTETRSVIDKDGHSNTETDHYYNKERYFIISELLIGSGIENVQTTLQAGQHCYNFTFKLPDNIPCTFDHAWGNVKYAVKAIQDRPWKFDKKSVSTFMVVAPPNAQKGPTRPISDNVRRKFHYCFFFSAGKMSINVCSQVSNIVPNEEIELIINYDNGDTLLYITEMKLKLVKDMTFHAMTKRNYDSVVLERVTKTGPFDIKGESTLKIALPSLSPPDLAHCSIIDVRYQLVLSIEICGMHRKITRSYPVQL